MSKEIIKQPRLLKDLQTELGLSDCKTYEILEKAIEAVQQFKAIKNAFLTLCNAGLCAKDIPSISAKLGAVVQEANEIEKERMHNHPSQLIILEPYDSKLLNSFGGGNVEYWHNYIRKELNCAHEWYEAQVQGD